jgi:hypothetical protein
MMFFASYGPPVACAVVSGTFLSSRWFSYAPILLLGTSILLEENQDLWSFWMQWIHRDHVWEGSLFLPRMLLSFEMFRRNAAGDSLTAH